MPRKRQSKQPAKRSFDPLGPLDASKEEREMFDSGDWTGWEYWNCDRIRRKKKRTPKESEQLAKHDVEEKRIERDPEAVMREAHEAIDRGTSLLLKLIRSGKLTTTLQLTEKGIEAGLRPIRNDAAVECFCSRLVYFNQQLVRLAEINVPEACRKLWFQAKELTEAFTRLALVHPLEFREAAENSLTMPSLRTRHPKFTAGAEAIAEAIHLAEKHPAPKVWDNNSRVGGLCHLVIARLLENVHYARQEYEWERESLAGLQVFHETAEAYRGLTLHQLLASQMRPPSVAHILACAALPDWKDDPKAWWKGRVLALVKEEFAKLAEKPIRNLPLWEELKRGGERNTEKDMRRYMEKICKNKFDQIAKECP